MLKKILSFSVLCFALAGCTAAPPVDFTVEEVGIIDNRKDAELRSLTVGYASQKQQKTVQGNHEVPPLWKEALQDALNRSLAFTDDASKKVNLSVRIIELDTPEFGASMTTKTAAIYEIVDRKTGDLLFAETIESEGVVPMNYAFVGYVRAIESLNRAVRNNIADFINRLDNSDLSKPMFLGKK